MRLAKVSAKPAFLVTCKLCGKKAYSNEIMWYADLDGEPFKVYYCADCYDIVHAEEYLENESRSI